VVRAGPEGLGTLASHYDGRELNSPNDIVARSDGAIYFTDPPSGRSARYGIERPQELPFQGVYRIDTDGSLSLLVGDFERPNGLCFSLDERVMFVNDTARAHIRAFDVAPTGALENGRLWATLEGSAPGVADGMKIDGAGNLYCTGPGGIHVFAPDATWLGVILTPERAANFTWGDADRRTLYITATTSIYTLRTTVAGAR
jgi:gluconolactonase